jgi:DNA-binding HxlR family transcriptional regulator
MDALVKTSRRPYTARPASGSRPSLRLRERNCSVARVVSILSDAWTFLVIREAFFGARRFEGFRAALGIPRATLTDRLMRLTHQGIFRQIRYSKSSRRVEYRLTEAGLELYPSFMAMMQFGDRWLAAGKPPPLRLVHISCGKECRPIVACSACHERVSAARVSYRNGPGAGYRAVQPVHRARRSSDSAQYLRGRPSSVSRTLQIIGDRWSFLIIREAFFGARRFERLQSELNIASNILADRLGRLVGQGVFERRKYQDQPERFEYRLTEMGMDLYGPLIAMMAWGDRWLSHGRRPLILTHRDCKKDFVPTVECDRCHQPIKPQDMQYHLNYAPADFGVPELSDRSKAIRDKQNRL